MSARIILSALLAVGVLVMTIALPGTALAGEREDGDEREEFFEEFDDGLFFRPRFGLFGRLGLVDDLDDFEDIEEFGAFRRFGFRAFGDDD